MLVATLLVVVMMLLFAEIFGAAVEVMTSQRALASNDQKARSVTTIVRSDLQRLVYRQSVSTGRNLAHSFGGGVILESPRGIVPLSPGDQPDARQRGFFYVSENDPLDDSDDVLHLVVDIRETLRNPTVSNPSHDPYFGRAQGPRQGFSGVGTPNQPDWDDGVINNLASSSGSAEVRYFLRGGNLYRRVMLIREPLPSAAPPFTSQPSTGSNGTGGPFNAFETPYPSGSFYNDWDFSGTRILVVDNDMPPDGPSPEPGDTYRFRFHGSDAMDNTLGFSNFPLADPRNRFGGYFDGRSREWLLDSAGDPVAFIGAFTLGETSHDLFLWPGVNRAAASNMMLRSDLILSPESIVSIDGNTNGIFDAGDTDLFGSRAPRTGEEILLTNVEAFDVKFWDTGFAEIDGNGNGSLDPAEDRNGNGIFDAGIWVDPGNDFELGHYTLVNNLGPTPGNNNTTWGAQNPGYGPLPNVPNRVYDTWHPSLPGVPPFRPLQVDPSGPSAITWAPGGSVSRGDVVFPDAPTSNFSIGYVALRSGTTGSRSPDFPRLAGSTIEDGTVTWRAFDNRIGLEKMLITVRYRDVTSNKPRQVSIIHSFVE